MSQYVDRNRAIARHARAIHALLSHLQRQEDYLLFRLWDPYMDEVIAESTLPLEIVESMADWPYGTFTITMQNNVNEVDEDPWWWVDLDLTAIEAQDLFHDWGVGVDHGVKAVLGNLDERVTLEDIIDGKVFL